MAYSVVEFKSDNRVAIVRTKWIVGTGEAKSCFWPTQRRHQAVLSNYDPDERTWQKHPLLRIFKTVGKRLIYGVFAKWNIFPY